MIPWTFFFNALVIVCRLFFKINFFQNYFTQTQAFKRALLFPTTQTDKVPLTLGMLGNFSCSWYCLLNFFKINFFSPVMRFMVCSLIIWGSVYCKQYGPSHRVTTVWLWLVVLLWTITNLKCSSLKYTWSVLDWSTLDYMQQMLKSRLYFQTKNDWLGFIVFDSMINSCVKCM